MKKINNSGFLKRLGNFDSTIKDLKQKRRKLINEFQNKCPHPVDSIVESQKAYRGRPIRVCTICRYAEEGWGCGYAKLAPKIYGSFNIKQVSIEESYSLWLTLQENKINEDPETVKK